jgi:Flp pilus assembly protein TadG
MMRRALTWLRQEDGSSAVEFALLLIPSVLLIFGIIHVSLLMYTIQQLNFATEATARCMVTATSSKYSSQTCYTDASAKSYFQALYKGPTAAPSYVQFDRTQTCATTPSGDTTYQVITSTTYTVKAAFISLPVSLRAKACFPHT